jgi:hypothetical protein
VEDEAVKQLEATARLPGMRVTVGERGIPLISHLPVVSTLTLIVWVTPVVPELCPKSVHAAQACQTCTRGRATLWGPRSHPVE